MMQPAGMRILCLWLSKRWRTSAHLARSLIPCVKFMERINNTQLKPSLVSQEKELGQILELEKKNLAIHISEDEIRSDGFVTLSHNLETLQKMHQLAPSVIIKNADTVIAYAL